MSKYDSDEYINSLLNDEGTILGIDSDSSSKNDENSKVDDEFQKEFRAVFDDTAEAENKKKKNLKLLIPTEGASGVYDWIRCVILQL